MNILLCIFAAFLALTLLTLLTLLGSTVLVTLLCLLKILMLPFLFLGQIALSIRQKKWISFKNYMELSTMHVQSVLPKESVFGLDNKVINKLNSSFGNELDTSTIPK